MDTGDTSAAEPADVAAAMAGTLQHRGPDAHGAWGDVTPEIGLGFQRLAVIDPTAHGAQPMHGPRGVLVFNGEIYNHRAIRTELDAAERRRWVGHSDTEVLLAALERWGVEPTLQRLEGMFAFAYWDRSDRALWLARDRFGEKPLYVGRFGTCVMFGSELKALRRHPSFEADVDTEALAAYFRYGYVPAPRSIYQRVEKLQPGTWLRVTAAGGAPTLSRGRYWSPRDAMVAGAERPLAIGVDELTRALDAELCSAVAGRMEADVPLGAFLSGGIDSSAVVALMQAQSSRPVQTFTLGFHDDDFDEAPLAAAVARHLGTEHHEHYVTEHDAFDVIPRLPAMYDEPFADSSQIPTHLLASLARTRVTVALTGDGGDELFAGYPRYGWALQLERTVGRAPAGVLRALGRAVAAVGPTTWSRGYDALSPPLARRDRFGDRLHKFADVLVAPSPQERYLRMVTHWRDEREIVQDHGGHAFLGVPHERPPGTGSHLDWMVHADVVGYLGEGILTKVDRATMAVGLEARIPFLDHELFEFAARIPSSTKIRDGHGKWILRRVLDAYVPRGLVDRPKRGFSLPLAAWLRGPLREWATDLLAADSLGAYGFLRADVVQRKLDEHLRGDRDWQHDLWTALMFQSWCHETTR